jgi:hypothetical protein
MIRRIGISPRRRSQMGFSSCIYFSLRPLKEGPLFSDCSVRLKSDKFVKIRRKPEVVIPAKAGIQCFSSSYFVLDPGFRLGDGFQRTSRKFVYYTAQFPDVSYLFTSSSNIISSSGWTQLPIAIMLPWPDNQTKNPQRGCWYPIDNIRSLF